MTSPARRSTTWTERVPGWLPAEGNLETWLVEAMSNQAAELADVASAVPAAIFGYFGATVLGLPPFASAASATAQTTWTMVDGQGYTIPAGTLMGVRATGSELIPFETVQDVVIAVGATTAAITCSAVDPGTDANALNGACELIDAAQLRGLDHPCGADVGWGGCRNRPRTI
jgi:hypothetical protein